MEIFKLKVKGRFSFQLHFTSSCTMIVVMELGISVNFQVSPLQTGVRLEYLNCNLILFHG